MTTKSDMSQYRSWLPQAALVLIAATVLIGIATILFRRPSSRLLEAHDPSDFVRLQDNFFRLALMLDDIDWLYLQRQPVPDWILRTNPEQRDLYYSRILGAVDEVGQPSSALSTRVLREKYCYHFDALTLFPKEYRSFNSENLRKLRNLELQRDPFAPNCYLGYISVENDYCLVSVGPDKNADVMGFVHLVDGGYLLEQDMDFSDDWELIRELGSRRISYSGSPIEDRGASITIPVNLIYDPTNGIESPGDVIFWRSFGDNFMFSYPASKGVLETDDLIKKEIAHLQ